MRWLRKQKKDKTDDFFKSILTFRVFRVWPWQIKSFRRNYSMYSVFHRRKFYKIIRIFHGIFFKNFFDEKTFYFYCFLGKVFRPFGGVSRDESEVESVSSSSASEIIRSKWSICQNWTPKIVFKSRLHSLKLILLDS